MRKLNIIVIAGLLGLAAILGTFAATRTASLGVAARHATAASLTARSRQLDAYAAALRRSLARKPPALPAVPKTTAAGGPRTVYHRPPPRVAAMTSHTGRLYVLACGLVTFFLVWALVAAHPWGARADARVTALSTREARLRHEAVLVRQLVAQRWKTYHVELGLRRSQIAAARSASASSAAASVRVVNLPPLTITRTS
jgi:hypothetical protein